MDLQLLIDVIIDGDAPKAEALVNEALSEGVAPATIVNDGLIAAMGIVGERFGRGEIYVPEMLYSARAMQNGLTILEPLLAESGEAARGAIVIGTVKGDVHDIGKNIVGMMLKGPASPCTISASTSRRDGSSRRSASTVRICSACRPC